MGKNLKGKECGKGICQRKDGFYYARFVDEYGKRHEKYVPTLSEAQNWLEEARFADTHDNILVPSDKTVDAWFEFWQENMIADLAPNTRGNYWERYVHNIQPVIGGMLLSNVQPIHCKVVLNRMEADYAGSTIRQAYITMGTMFKTALMNGMRYSKPVRAVEEQGRFLETAQRPHNYAQYALILEMGLRIGEVIGLTWSAIDWEKRTLTVNKTLEYRHKQAFWRAGPPKTQQCYERSL